jgi:hypothetical protein
VTDDTTPTSTRDSALVLAGLHLRLGSMSLARAELETLAATGKLDQAGRIDLAEVRWRTGDLTGAGAAASKALTSDGSSVVAHVIAAEAASGLGRPSEARRLAGLALALSDGPIDPVFAGMPRSGVWPADPSEPVPSPVTLFPTERVAAWSQGDGRPVAPPVEPPAADEDRDDQPRADGARTAVPETGLWDVPDATTDQVTSSMPPKREPALTDAERLFEAARFALESGDAATAAVRLGLAVRFSPDLAPAILTLIGGTTDPGLLLVSGDAFAAIGEDGAARGAFRAAMAGTSPAPVAPSEPAEPAEPASPEAAEPAEPEAPATGRPPRHRRKRG